MSRVNTKENLEMKKMIKVVLLALVAASLLTACGEAPAEKIGAAKGAVDMIVGEGAEQYIPDDLAKVNKKLAEAMAEVNAQEGNIFKNFTTAEFYLTQVKEDCDLLKAKIDKRKDELKAAASAALSEALTAISEAKGLLEIAPQGKGSIADIEAMKGDIAGLETELAGVQPQIDSGEYIAAAEKARAVSARVMLVGNDVKLAQQKMGIEPKKL